MSQFAHHPPTAFNTMPATAPPADSLRLPGRAGECLIKESNPLDPVASEPLSHAGQVLTSDLSINELALLGTDSNLTN